LEARHPEREPCNTKVKTDKNKDRIQVYSGEVLRERYNESRGRVIRDKSRKEVMISR
jgi:hypothetical protein